MSNLDFKSKTVNPSTHQDYSRIENCSYSQLGLFVAPKPDLIVDRVPQNLALGDDRYYIRYGSWFAGIQLSKNEAYGVIGLIGRKRDPEAIYRAIERVIDGGVA